MLIVGRPAKAVRELTPEQIEGLRLAAVQYVERARLFREQLVKLA